MTQGKARGKAIRRDAIRRTLVSVIPAKAEINSG